VSGLLEIFEHCCIVPEKIRGMCCKICNAISYLYVSTILEQGCKFIIWPCASLMSRVNRDIELLQRPDVLDIKMLPPIETIVRFFNT
jgi:hypothetical protein